MAFSLLSLSLILLAVLGPLLYNGIRRELTVLGITRSPIFTSSDQGIHIVSDTQQCEDLHYYAPSGQIFTACEDSVLPRFQWFPPLVHLGSPPGSTGTIHIIDPQTKQSTRLAFENFRGPFITHGIDVIQDPDRSGAVYIFTVNHLPNPDHRPETESETPKARSQIEIFHHVLKSSTVRHVRSVRHDLVTTPNDIYATSPFSFYVTNDHYYRGGLMRHLEDQVPWTKWTKVMHVQLDNLDMSNGDAGAEAGVHATVALPRMHNCNGLGHGQSPEELLVASAIGGKMWRAKMNDDPNRTLSILEEIPLDSTIDNPSYYDDPYRTADHDASGYVLAGLRRAIDFSSTISDPAATESVIVWYVRWMGDSVSGEWEKRVIFEDDGSNIRTGSTAVLVPIKPSKKDSKKEAWLFVTGFVSSSVVAVKVEL
ncbi:serum paraoxonase/arylesterase family protein [Aspergillus californicus]